MTLTIVRSAFTVDLSIPNKYTCEGEDVSPPLAWSGAPANTKSFAVIADDPDAPMGTWVHWVVWNIPATSKSLAEGVAKVASLPDGTKQGITDFGRVGYGGPCPPPGKPHRYFFKLYALDVAALNVAGRGTKADLEKAVQGHILEKAELMGTFKR